MNRLQVAGAAALVLLSVGFFAQRCVSEPRIAFIFQGSEAPWIMHPLRPDGMMGLAERDALPVTRFLHRFELERVPPSAQLVLRALRNAELQVNGTRVAAAEGEASPWRHWRRFELAPHLRPGRNELMAAVTNGTGPPMLALHSEGLGPAVVSGPDWAVSQDGGPWRAAARVDASHSNPSGYALPQPGESAAARANTLLLLFITSALLFLATLSPRGRGLPALAARALPFLVGVIWLAFLARALEIPPAVGFDAHHHLKYVDYLREHWRLPLATDGWMMFHPPVYYLPTALLVELEAWLGSDSRIGWKLLGWLAGLATALICGALGARAFGRGTREAAFALGFGALVPMNVYISAYVTNESLHTALACAVVLVTAQGLRSDAPSGRWLLGWGALASAAVLTKYTAWIVVSIAGFFLAARWLLVERASLARVARRGALPVAVLLVLAGWFYARNWLHFGQPFPLNVDLPGETRQWWSQPGYYTPAFFLSFGDVLMHPFLAGYHSAWDSLYSTLWGDGQLAGQMFARARHPHWDWQLMASLYWLALPATGLLLWGALRSLVVALRPGDPGLRALHSFLLTLAYALFFSVLYMTLRQQDYGQAKAFYAMASIAPLSAFFALGCGSADRWLEARGLRWARALLYGWLGALGGAIVLSFAG